MLGVLVGALCWLALLVTLTVTTGNANMVVPLVLFLVLPCASATMSAYDLSGS